MAESTKADRKRADEARSKGEEVPIDAAADGVDSRLTRGYEDNPDKPHPTSVAQVEVLVDGEGSSS